MKQIHIIVQGRVQGIFFRDSVRREAAQLGLKGYVKNTNQDVEVVAQGDGKQIEKLVMFCHKGPPVARVDKVDFKYEEIEKIFNSFDVKY